MPLWLLTVKTLPIFFFYLSANCIKVSEIDPILIDRYRRWLLESKHNHPNSVRRKIIAIRQYLKSTFFEKPGSSLVAESIPIPERDDSLQKQFNKVKLHSLFDACASNSKLKELRDIALLALFAFEGLKSSELINLKFGDFLKTKNNLGSLRITGSRQRIITLNPLTTAAVVNYKSELKRMKMPAKQKKMFTHLFIAFKNRDCNSILPKMSRHGIKFNLYELGQKIGMDKLSSEVLRNYCIQSKLEAGLKVQEIMQHLGLKQPGLIAKHARQPKKQK